MQMAVLGSPCLIRLIRLVSWTSSTPTFCLFVFLFVCLFVFCLRDFQSLGAIVKIEVAVLGRP